MAFSAFSPSPTFCLNLEAGGEKPSTLSFLPTQESRSFAAGMFKGQLNTEQVFPYPSGQWWRRRRGEF